MKTPKVIMQCKIFISTEFGSLEDDINGWLVEMCKDPDFVVKNIDQEVTTGVSTRIVIVLLYKYNSATRVLETAEQKLRP